MNRLLQILVILYFILCIIVGAYTAKMMWLWFVVPLGMPTIGMLHAIGLILTTNTFVGGRSAGLVLSWMAEGHKDRQQQRYAMYIMLPLLTLFFGWIIQLFM